MDGEIMQHYVCVCVCVTLDNLPNQDSVCAHKAADDIMQPSLQTSITSCWFGLVISCWWASCGSYNVRL